MSFSSDSFEDECDQGHEDDIYNMKVRKPKPKPQEPAYTFDEKVAIEIVNIHRKVNQKKQDTDFSRWVEKNLRHLEYMHCLSNKSLSFEQFATFVYEH